MSNPDRSSRWHVGCSNNVAGKNRCPLAVLSLLALPFLASSFVQAQSSTTYQQTNIVSDGFVQAQTTDPNMLNPWGVALGGAFWINANGGGQDLVDDASGNKKLSVTVPSVLSTKMKGSPTGVVLNTSTSIFMLSDGAPAKYLFATLDGSVSGWNSAVSSNAAYNNTAIVVIDNSATGAAYTDLAVLTSGGATDLLLANFSQGKIEVYDQNFKPTTLSGNFTDPNLPANFAPYGIHVFNNEIYVTYAEEDPTTHHVVLGAGNGLVDVYDQNGNFMQEAILHGNLNAPWGMALAPSGFGTYSGDLLVGNFGDGVINVYNASNYAFVGQLMDASGKAIANPGLWEIVFGSSTLGNPNTLYLAAGLNQAKDGLFASIAAVAPTGPASFTFTASTGNIFLQSGQTGTTTLSLAPTNGFTGTVTFACSGLPSGATCSFSPSSVMISGGKSATTTLTVSTTGAGMGMGMGTVPYATQSRLMRNGFPGLIGLSAAVFLLPIGVAGTLFGRSTASKPYTRALFLVIFFIGGLGLMVGCGGYNKMGSTYIPPPSKSTTSTVTVTATSGAASQSVNFTLTVQ